MSIWRSLVFLVVSRACGLVLVTAIGAMLAVACTAGGTWQHYRFSAFEEARNRNMTIYLHFHDEGDSSSRKQKEVLEELIKSEQFKGVGAYRVQLKKEKDLEKFARVSSAPTLIVYKGTTERGRVGPELDPAKLRSLLEAGF